jgi:hypothetical protein
MRFVRETGTGVRSRCAWDIKECKGRLGKHLDAIIYLLYHSMEENLRRNPSISIARHTASTSLKFLLQVNVDEIYLSRTKEIVKVSPRILTMQLEFEKSKP